jgi:hypothetical protein
MSSSITKDERHLLRESIVLLHQWPLHISVPIPNGLDLKIMIKVHWRLFRYILNDKCWGFFFKQLLICHNQGNLSLLVGHVRYPRWIVYIKRIDSFSGKPRLRCCPAFRRQRNTRAAKPNFEKEMLWHLLYLQLDRLSSGIIIFEARTVLVIIKRGPGNFIPFWLGFWERLHIILILQLSSLFIMLKSSRDISLLFRSTFGCCAIRRRDGI